MKISKNYVFEDLGYFSYKNVVGKGVDCQEYQSRGYIRGLQII